jgi:thiosulfate dehydrogenase
MKKRKIYAALFIVAFAAFAIFISCNENKANTAAVSNTPFNTDSLFKMDSLKMPKGKYGESVRYGRELILRTAYFIGPNGINGKYL